jgi:hypothetical protein
MSPSAPAPYEPPHADAPRSSHLLRNASVGCGGLFLAAVLCIGSCALLTKRIGDKELNPVAEAYFAKVDRGDYHGAYVDFGPAMHASTSEASYVSFDEGIHGRLGKILSKSAARTQTGYGTQGEWADVDYNCRFERGSAAIHFKFQKSGDRWQIAGVHYDSPQLTEALGGYGKEGADR